MCGTCGTFFSRSKHEGPIFSDLQQFHDLVVGKVNRDKLAEKKVVSRKTLSLKLKVFFNKPVFAQSVFQSCPPQLTRDTKPWILAIDGKWLRRQGVVMIYRDITHGENLYWSFWPSESYAAIATDLKVLTSLLGSHRPAGVVSDWKGAIVAGVATYFSGVTHQRCLAHVVREAKTLLPKLSAIPAVLALRAIAKQLPYVMDKGAAIEWKAQLIQWEKTFGTLLKERTVNQEPGKRKWWYTHGNLRRGWRVLTDDWYPFFVHLEHSEIPKTNNSIEGVNGQLKNKLLNHRGMKTLQQVSFIFWYLICTRTQTKQALRAVWQLWKSS